VTSGIGVGERYPGTVVPMTTAWSQNSYDMVEVWFLANLVLYWIPMISPLSDCCDTVAVYRGGRHILVDVHNRRRLSPTILLLQYFDWCTGNEGSVWHAWIFRVMSRILQDHVGPCHTAEYSSRELINHKIHHYFFPRLINECSDNSLSVISQNLMNL
jgi:hypothetical protein